MRRCETILVVAVWMWPLVLAGPVSAQAPIPAGPECNTALKFGRALLKARVDRLDDYKKHTQDPPAVQADALAFLQDFERKHYLAPEARSWGELAKTGEQLRDRGSRDPLVLMFVGVARNRADAIPNDHALEAELWKCYDGFAGGSYPDLWKFEPFCHMPEKWTSRIPQGKPSSAELIAALAKAWICDPAPAADENHPRFRWRWIEPFLETLDVGHQQTIRDTCLKFPDQDGWLQNLLAGVVHIHLAWYYRGNYVAVRVTAKGAQDFESNLVIAEKYLRNAWQINSRFPEAPTRLISVAMGGSSSPESIRVWFDRAVAAQMDFPPAYRNYMWALRPRWGGSHAALYAFGRECLATKRVDTDVPYLYIQALRDIEEDLDETSSSFRKDDVWAAAHPMLETLMSAGDRGYGLRPRTQFASDLMLLAVWTGHFDEARSAFNVLEAAKVKSAANSLCHVRESTARAIVLGTSGPAAEAARRVMPHLLALKRVPEEARGDALDALREVLAKDKNEAVQNWFRHWQTTLLWEQAYDAGQWVDLSFSPTLAGWIDQEGKWRFKDEQTVVASLPESTDGLQLLCNARFPGPFELRARFAIPGKGKQSHAPAITISADADADDGREPSAKRVFWVIPEQGRAGISDRGDSFPGVQTHVDRAGFNDMRLLLWPEEHDFYVNGRQLGIVKPTPKLPRTRVSLGLAYAKDYKPPTLTFQNVRIRKLTRQPPPPVEDSQGWIAYYTESLAEDPQDANALCRRGAAYLDTKNLDAAEADLTKAIALRPGNSEVHNLLGLVLERQHNIDGALREYDQAAALDFVQVHAFKRIAWIKATCPDAKYRDGAAAVKAASRAVALTRSTEWGALTTLAAAHAESGAYGEAVKAAKKALAVAPEDQKEMLTKFLKQCEDGKPERDSELEPATKGGKTTGAKTDQNPASKPGEKSGKTPAKS